MDIQLNGTLHVIAENNTITQLIEALDLAGKRIAVELNQEIIPASEHDETVLTENDAVEIVHAIGGG